MKTLQTMITPDYCPDWGRLEAIREWITNALDAGTEYKINYSENTSTLVISSEDTKLSLDHLMMGYSQNRGKESSVGTHGEGMLVAMGVALREGLDVYMVNGDEIWAPSFKKAPLVSSKCLVIDVEDNHHHQPQFNVVVEGVKLSEWTQIKLRFLPLQNLNNEEILECELGRVFLNRRGKLYVGGVYVKETGLDYTYDFHPKYLPLNRDRMSVDSWDLGTKTAELWKLASSAETVATMIHSGSNDLRYMEYSSLSQSKEIDEACFNMYHEKYAGKQLTESSAEKRKLEAEGFTNVEVVNNSNFVSSVKRTESYSKLTFTKEEYQPIDLLREALDDALKQYQEGSHTYIGMWSKLNDVLDKFEARGVMWR